MTDLIEAIIGGLALGAVLVALILGALRVLSWRSRAAFLPRVEEARVSTQAHLDNANQCRVRDVIMLQTLDVTYRVALAHPEMDAADVAIVARTMLLSGDKSALPSSIGLVARTHGVDVEDVLAECLAGFVQRRDLDLGVTS